MAKSDLHESTYTLHPAHGVLLASSVPLYLGATLSDMAYSNSYQIQWTNFASWLVAGGNLFAVGALVWAVTHLALTGFRFGAYLLYVMLLVATSLLGFFNSLIHAKDAWASMPTGLVLSVIVMLLAVASVSIGFAKFGVGGHR